jgi:hypothetical protein
LRRKAKASRRLNNSTPWPLNPCTDRGTGPLHDLLSKICDIYGPAADAKGPLNRHTKEDRCWHLSGLLLKGIMCPSGPDEMRASPPQYNRGLGGHVAKQSLEKPV